jgi:NIPSNAP
MSSAVRGSEGRRRRRSAIIQNTSTEADRLAAPSWSPIVELRRYTLHPGMREVLIELFDRDLVEPQEQAGMKVIGQFRDLDTPDTFTWLRGFPDMPKRAAGLAAFYDGPVWRANRDRANATMVDSDDVLLLRPARLHSAFTLEGSRPPPGVDDGTRRGFVEATILYLEAPADQTGILPRFEREVTPAVVATGATLLGYFVTEPSVNNFPRLPVREADRVLVWFAGFADRAALDRASRAGGAAGGLAERLPGLKEAPRLLRLAPTAGSLLTGLSPACPTTSSTAARDREEPQL